MWLDLLLLGVPSIATLIALHHTVIHRTSHPHEFTILGLQALPFIILIFAFLIDYDALRTVQINGSHTLPIHYRISAVWAGRSGPLLLWIAMLVLVRLWWRHLSSENVEKKTIGTAGVLHCLIFFLFIVAFLLQPFSLDNSVARSELNVFLQTDLMVIHPPIVFAFYAFCLAVGSVALEGMLNGKNPSLIHQEQLPLARAAFVSGTLGIGLGGLWAYSVLDWGGYWAWDPVETASLLPWLCTLLIVHLRMSPKVKNRGSAIVWSPALGLLTGALAMHSTLVTRANGAWASVHAFVASENGDVLANDAYVRVLSLWNSGAEGAEVLLQFIVMLVFIFSATYWLGRHQAEKVLISGQEILLTSRPILGFLIVIGIISILINSGSLSVAILLLPSIFLMLHDRDQALLWPSIGVTILLFSRWSWHLDSIQAGIGMFLLLLPWLLAPEEDKAEQFPSLSKLALHVPLAGGGSFLVLTWLLLLAEIDGSSPEAHEAFGSILIGLLSAALLIYSLRSATKFQRRAILTMGIFISISAAIYGMEIFPLPGNSDQLLTQSINRGHISRFLLVWLIIAAPPSIADLASTIRKITTTRDRKPASLRLLGSHMAHAGILLLLIGHVLTTTLVDRVDPSHQITLIRNEEVRHGDYIFKMTDILTTSPEDPEYDERFSIGDGFFGIHIEVYDLSGDLLGSVEPGVLRFDSADGAIRPRSEVDRIVHWTGDTILILDLTQMNQIMTQAMMGELDDVDRIRLTVYDLPGSHMVWIGWAMIVLGSSLTLTRVRTNESDESE
ncbi:MAG: cytochrome c biogenesis protein CcsA [Candidatus Thalassarchaeaceae archaeon]|jgi:cytochrome c biogenesis factor|nr:cytochrome c biogenesis protein CcsA [Candidatus Thalassarchaeaceae archaeon]